MILLCSAAICPPNQIVGEVKLLKHELKDEIGKFPSENSEAHITFNNFLIEETELLACQNFLNQYCQSLYPFEIILNKTGSYPNGAFYLAPDDNSKKILIELMKDFNKKFPFKTKSKLSNPHMSIARGLDPNKLNITQGLFSNKKIELRFTCDNMALRIFDPLKGQYFIRSTHAFRIDGE